MTGIRIKCGMPCYGFGVRVVDIRTGFVCGVFIQLTKPVGYLIIAENGMASFANNLTYLLSGQVSTEAPQEPPVQSSTEVVWIYVLAAVAVVVAVAGLIIYLCFWKQR